MVKSYNLDQKHQEHHPKTFVTWFELMFCLKYLMHFYIFAQRLLIEVVFSSKLAQCGGGGHMAHNRNG